MSRFGSLQPVVSSWWEDRLAVGNSQLPVHLFPASNFTLETSNSAQAVRAKQTQFVRGQESGVSDLTPGPWPPGFCAKQTQLRAGRNEGQVLCGYGVTENRMWERRRKNKAKMR